jgi:hypothetical protein
VGRLETEVRQLHQVIAQLRNAQKNKKETVDSALADRSSQKEVIDKQQAEIAELREAVRRYAQCEAANTSLHEEVREITLLQCFVCGMM